MSNKINNSPKNLKCKNKKPFKCTYFPPCKKAFTNNANLEVHIRKHTGEKPFLCYLCPKRFAQKTTLGQHLRFHLNIRPYKCSTCQKTFIQASNLNNHLRIHDKQVKKREYKSNLKIVNVFSIQDLKPVLVVKEEKAEATMRRIPNFSKNLDFNQPSWWFQCKVCKVCIKDEQKFIIHKQKHPNYDDPILIDISDCSDESSEEAEEKAATPTDELERVSSSSVDSSNTQEISSIRRFSAETERCPSASSTYQENVFHVKESLVKKERVGPKCAKRKWKLQAERDNHRKADKSIDKCDKIEVSFEVASASKNIPTTYPSAADSTS